MDGDEIRTLRESTPHGELVLRWRGGAQPWAMLLLEGSILMDSDSRVSERALAARGLARLESTLLPDGGGSRAGCRVLLAGLGLGITLHELLGGSRVARVEVIEILPTLVRWNREPLAPLNGDPLADPRVTCHVTDLRDLLLPDTAPDPERCRVTGAPYELMLFDIDNGPAWLSRSENHWLYEPSGLAAVRRQLAVGGWAAYWAADADPGFEAALAALAWADWEREEVPWQTPRGGRTLAYQLYWLLRKR